MKIKLDKNTSKKLILFLIERRLDDFLCNRIDQEDAIKEISEMASNWIEEERSKREGRRIKISEVNDLATEIIRPKYLQSYFARRDLILTWLKERKIRVWGRRSR